jgi:hypothetical protein
MQEDDSVDALLHRTATLGNTLNDVNLAFDRIPLQRLNAEQQVLVNAASVAVQELTSFVGGNSDIPRTTLPVVPKEVLTGSRGGAYYVNSKGRRVWLKKNQRDMCKRGALLGSGYSCPREIREYNRSH